MFGYPNAGIVSHGSGIGSMHSFLQTDKMRSWQLFFRKHFLQARTRHRSVHGRRRWPGEPFGRAVIVMKSWVDLMCTCIGTRTRFFEFRFEIWRNGYPIFFSWRFQNRFLTRTVSSLVCIHICMCTATGVTSSTWWHDIIDVVVWHHCRGLECTQAAFSGEVKPLIHAMWGKEQAHVTWLTFFNADNVAGIIVRSIFKASFVMAAHKAESLALIHTLLVLYTVHQKYAQRGAVRIQIQCYLYNPIPFALRKFCWIREGAGLENLIYCWNVHERDILVADNNTGSYKGWWFIKCWTREERQYKATSEWRRQHLADGAT